MIEFVNGHDCVNLIIQITMKLALHAGNLAYYMLACIMLNRCLYILIMPEIKLA